MRKIALIGLCCIGLVGNAVAQKNKAPKVKEVYAATKGKFEAIDFPSDEVGYAVGLTVGAPEAGKANYSGIVVKTANGGKKWEQLYTQKDAMFYDAHFRNENEGVVVGAYRKDNRYAIALRTINGGETWKDITPPDVSRVIALNQIQFVNDSVGYLVGDRLWKTTDFGTTWTELKINLGIYVYYSIHFLNANEGWVAGTSSALSGSPTLFYTGDGGQSWISVDREGRTNRNLEVSFVSKDYGYLFSRGTMHRTRDGGLKWEKMPEKQDPKYDEMYWLNEREGYLFGLFDGIRATVDGGKSWENYRIAAGTSVGAMVFTDYKTGFIGLGNGKILRIKR